MPHPQLFADHPEYRRMFQDVTNATWLYEHGYPDPTNGTFSIITQPQVLIGYPDYIEPSGWHIDAEYFQTAAASYKQMYISYLTYNPWAENQNQILSNPAQLVGTFIRIEQPPLDNRSVRFVSWHMLGSEEATQTHILRPICIEDSIHPHVIEVCKLQNPSSE